MRYVIDKENRPVYLQLYKQIRDDILSEIYPYNAKLPSKRRLAEEYLAELARRQLEEQAKAKAEADAPATENADKEDEQA